MAAIRGMHVRMRNIAMRDYRERVTTGLTHGQTYTGQNYPYVPLCFAVDTSDFLFLMPNMFLSSFVSNEGQRSRSKSRGQNLGLNRKVIPQGIHTNMCNMKVPSLSVEKIRPRLSFHRSREVSILYAKRKWSCGAETVKSYVQILPLTFWPKVNRGPPQVKVNIYVKYHHCMSNGRGVIVQKTLFHRRTDRWEDSHGESSIPPQLRWRGYTNLFSIWRYRWKMTPLPGSQNFMGKPLFSRPLVQNLMFKFEPC